MEAINKGRMAGKKCKMKERQEGRPGVGSKEGTKKNWEKT